MKRQPILEFYEVKEGRQKGKLGIRFKGANGEILFGGEGYRNQQDRLNAWNVVCRAVLSGEYKTVITKGTK